MPIPFCQRKESPNLAIIKWYLIGTSLSEPHHMRTVVKSVFLLAWLLALYVIPYMVESHLSAIQNYIKHVIVLTIACEYAIQVLTISHFHTIWIQLSILWSDFWKPTELSHCAYSILLAQIIATYIHALPIHSAITRLGWLVCFSWVSLANPVNSWWKQ